MAEKQTLLYSDPNGSVQKVARRTKLTQGRKVMNLAQVAFAKKLKLTRITHYCEYERGVRDLNQAQIQEIADLVKLPADIVDSKKYQHKQVNNKIATELTRVLKMLHNANSDTINKVEKILIQENKKSIVKEYINLLSKYLLGKNHESKLKKLGLTKELWNRIKSGNIHLISTETYLAMLELELIPKGKERDLYLLIMGTKKIGE